ncbi:MAG: hypothetical protein ACYC2O_12250 [Microthrixaceae bacterium]
MDDDQECCAVCVEETSREATMGGYRPEHAGIDLPPGGGTAVLAPPRAVPLPETVTYRSSGPAIRPKVLLLLIPVAALLVAGLGYLGHGPMADQFVRWGLTEERAELLPEVWFPVTDLAGSFRAELPAGTTHVFAALDPDATAAGGLVGERVDGVDGTQMEAGWTTFDHDEATVATFASPAGVRELADRFIDLRLGGAEPTVIRDVQVPEGHAVDVVLADDATTTTRVRFVLADGRFYALRTTGPDSGSRELDAAHQRLLRSFDPET